MTAHQKHASAVLRENCCSAGTTKCWVVCHAVSGNMSSMMACK
jgi:hypothetical protein